MKKCMRVAVCDNSLYMAGIAASLKADPTLEVLCMNLDNLNSQQRLDEDDLAAIVFDVSDPPVRLDITILRYQPGLLLIGVDPSRDEMLVLSSHPAEALSMADLVEVIHQKEADTSFFRAENREKNYER